MNPLPDWPFQNWPFQKWNGIPVIIDPLVPRGTVYILTPDHLKRMSARIKKAFQATLDEATYQEEIP